jgi:hypothetical protein
MHLSNEQLTELDDVGRLHINQCEVCRAKANNLIKLRQNLNQLSENAEMPGNWRNIQKIHTERQQVDLLKQTRKQLNQWRIGSLALAASLTAVIFWPTSQSSLPASESINWQLATLIEQNNFLQKKLNETDHKGNLAQVSFKLIEREIQSIDQAIQRAYLQGASDDEKAKLWSKRQKLMKQLLSDKKQPKMLRI